MSVPPTSENRIYQNPAAATWTSSPFNDPAILSFHAQLPDYAPTPLVSLTSLAASLGVRAVLLKDESARCGLPSFKILGASWAVYRAVAQRTSSSLPISLEALGKSATEQGVALVTCTDGNWGRAVARMARYLGIRATVFVPANMYAETRALIVGEDAVVEEVCGDYEDAIRASEKRALETGNLMVMDTSWAGYEEIPEWVVNGYSTGLEEIDKQAPALIHGGHITHVVASVGVGSWAQAVVQHYKKGPTSVKVITVEPTAAPCLYESLRSGQILTVPTSDTIMSGMNCNTPSLVAWPVLRQGVDIAVLVEDEEAHEAVGRLMMNGVRAGPCGAAGLCAIERLRKAGLGKLGENSVVLLMCTEGERVYPGAEAL